MTDAHVVTDVRASGAAAPVRDSSASDELLARLEFTVLRRLDGLVQGDFRTLFFGSGVDFADLREYEPSDDVRLIDWNVTARVDTPHVRQYHEQREVTAWLLIDRSKSMRFGPGERTKARAQLELTATLARVLTRAGNRVGAALWDENRIERVLEPRTGRSHVLHLIHHLLRDPAPSPPAGATSLGDFADDMARRMRRRSLVVVLSDFITADGWEAPLGRLAQRHETVGLRIVAPSELELPAVGPITIEDVETGEQLRVDTSDKGFRSRFAEAVAAHEAEVAAVARRAGLDLHTIDTDGDLARALAGVAERRRQARRR